MFNEQRRKTSKAKKDEAKAKASKKATAKRNAKPKKKDIFPFLDLPPELRNTIYEYTLTDPDGMNIISKVQGHRRVVKRGSIEKTTYRGWRHHHRQVETKRDGSGRPPLRPVLLGVNRQINKEAATMLYGQTLHFEDTVALYHFLAQIGHANRLLVENVVLHAWGLSGAQQNMNHPAFTMLAEAKSLQQLSIDCDIYYGYSTGVREMKKVASKLFRGAHPWFEAVGAARGSKDAALEILDLDGSNFGRVNTRDEDVAKAGDSEVESKEKKAEDERVERKYGYFRKELIRLLNK